MKTEADFTYITGGTVPANSPTYIERAADRQILETLQRGELCYVLDTRQVGKSSLMVRAATRLRESGARVVVLDLTSSGQNATLDQWYYGLLLDLGEQVGLQDELKAFWKSNRDIAPLPRWMAAIRHVVLSAFILEHSAFRLIIFIDEIEAVRSLPFSADEFFAGIRECYTRRAHDPEMEHLVFCLLGSATPDTLIQDINTTPFNIGRRIELTDFTEAEAAPLALGLVGLVNPISPIRPISPSSPRNPISPNSPTKAQTRLLQRILHWTGGHPYLTQRLCAAIAQDAAIDSTTGVDRLCDDLFFTRKARETETNLSFVGGRFLRSGLDIASLLGLYAQVRDKKAVRDDPTNPLHGILKLSGLVRTVDGCLWVRNRIYFRAFDREWIDSNLPRAELKRQRAALLRARLQVAAVAGVIVAVMAGLAWKAQWEAGRAKVAESKQRSATDKANLALSREQNALKEKSLALAKAERDFEKAKNSEAKERVAKGEANRNAARAKQYAEVSDRLSYTTNLNAIPTYYERGDSGRVRELLSLTRPHLRGFEWGYWNRLCNLEIRSENPGVGLIGSVGFTSDGKGLLIKGTRGNVIEDVGSGKSTTIATTGIVKSTYLVKGLAFSPNGRRIENSGDFGARVWDAECGRELITINGSVLEVNGHTVSPDGRYLAIAPAKGDAIVVDLASGKKVALTGHEDHVTCVAYSLDGKYIVTGSDDDTARVWDAITGVSLWTLKGHEGLVKCAAFSPDGKRIITGSWDKTVRIWDTVSRRCIRTLNGHNKEVNCLTISPNGTRFVTGSNDNVAKVWETQSGREVLTLKGHTDKVTSVAFSKDGRLVATGSWDGTAKLWDTQSTYEVLILKTPGTLPPKEPKPRWVTSVGFSTDGRKIISGSYDEIARIWNLYSAEELLKVDGHQKCLNAVGFSPDGKHFVTGSGDTTATIWNSQTKEHDFPSMRHSGPISAAAYSCDGNRVVTGSWDRTARIWDAHTGRLVRSLTGHSGPVLCAGFYRNGKRVVTGSVDGTAIVWDSQTGTMITTFRGHFEPNAKQAVNSVAFAPNGTRVVSGSTDKTARVWDVATGHEIIVLKGHDGSVCSAVYSPDGRRIATGSFDRTVKLWDAEKGHEVLSPKGPTLSVNSVAFSPKGNALAAGCNDGNIYVWFANFKSNSGLATQ